jgi:hypothetical protein
VGDTSGTSPWQTVQATAPVDLGSAAFIGIYLKAMGNPSATGGTWFRDVRFQ